jgi:hypothetical protein
MPMLYENLNCNSLVAVMRKYLISAHLYSTICALQTWVLGFWQHEDLMDGNWLSTKSTCSSRHLEFEEISWYSIKIRKLGKDKPTKDTKFNWYLKSIVFELNLYFWNHRNKHKLATICFANFASFHIERTTSATLATSSNEFWILSWLHSQSVTDKHEQLSTWHYTS